MMPHTWASELRLAKGLDPCETVRSFCCSHHLLTVFPDLVAPFTWCSSHPLPCLCARLGESHGRETSGGMGGADRAWGGEVSQMGVFEGMGCLIVPVGSTWLKISCAY